MTAATGAAGQVGAGVRRSADVERAAGVVRARLDRRPEVALVLGSGLGSLVEEVADRIVIPVAEVPGLPVPQVPGHAGRLVAGQLGGAQVLVLAGRVHMYEGYSARRVAMATRVAAALGCHTLLATNAAGGLNPGYHPGDLMAVADHLNLLGDNPLRGEPAFVDLAGCYDAELREAALRAGTRDGGGVHAGVYAACPGPSYETPAEVAALRRLGADAVGMSTVPEAIAARAAGLRVAAVSVITNVHRPGGTPVSHAEVLAAGDQARRRLRAVVLGVLAVAAGV